MTSRQMQRIVVILLCTTQLYVKMQLLVITDYMTILFNKTFTAAKKCDLYKPSTPKWNGGKESPA